MARTETLTSPQNPLLKEVRRAVSRGSLTAGGCCVAETFHLLEEALRGGCELQAVLAAESARPEVERILGRTGKARLMVLSDHLFAGIAATETSQGVMALVRPPEWRLEQLLQGTPMVVVLDGVQDPGNAGAIVRAAEAFGASGMMFLKGTVSPYNPKTVRASAGSLFRVPLVHGLDAEQALGAIEGRGLAFYAAMPAAGRTISEADLTGGFAFVVGSEGRGVSEQLRRAALELRIPTAGVESLNAAMAAGILLYEACRQRKANPEQPAGGGSAI